MEAAARSSLEQRRGSPFTDDEWLEARANLLAFFGILAEWDAAERAEHAVVNELTIDAATAQPDDAKGDKSK